VSAPWQGKFHRSVVFFFFQNARRAWEARTEASYESGGGFGNLVDFHKITEDAKAVVTNMKRRLYHMSALLFSD